MISLAFLALVNLDSLISLVTFSRLRFFGIFIIASFVGISLGQALITGKTSVFFHEFKHSLFSGLVGNRGKKMEVKHNSGSFTYEYTPETAKYNAPIALAPYWTPLFTVPTLLLPYCVTKTPLHSAHAFIVGIAYGVDFIMNVRDIGPHQTDFSRLRGGYRAGLLYTMLINVATLTILLAWILAEKDGIRALIAGLWHFTALLMGGKIEFET